MPTTNVEDRVIEIVAEQFGVDQSEITRDTHLVNDLNGDSLDHVELIMEIEDEFEISITDEAAEDKYKVGEIIDYVKEQLAP